MKRNIKLFPMFTAALCDADRRSTSNSTFYVSNRAEVHAYHAAYIKRTRAYHRIAKKLVKP